MESNFIENGLLVFIHSTRIILEFISVLCIICGLIATAKLILRYPSVLRNVPFSDVRLCFGSWLALALEFQLGSDIVSTTVSPNLNSLGKLAALAIIRTFLNYFLNKELEHQQKSEQLKEELKLKT